MVERENFLNKIFRKPLLSLVILLGAFFLTLVIMSIVFWINMDIFDFYINSSWANDFSRPLIPSVWGVFQIIIIVGALLAAIYCDKKELKIGPIEVSWILLVVAGVFLQLMLTGAYTKIVW